MFYFVETNPSVIVAYHRNAQGTNDPMFFIYKYDVSDNYFIYNRYSVL